MGLHPLKGDKGRLQAGGKLLPGIRPLGELVDVGCHADDLAAHAKHRNVDRMPLRRSCGPKQSQLDQKAWGGHPGGGRAGLDPGSSS